MEKAIQEFYLRKLVYMTMESTFTYILENNEGKATLKILPFDGETRFPAKPFLLPEETMRTFIQILDKYEVLSWDGFDEVDRMACDGGGFTLRITFTDGTVINARGTNAYPKDFHYFQIELFRLFKPYWDQMPGLEA